jgi:hypothetical protein
MKARIVDAGTKYFAISFCSLLASALFGRTEIFRLMMPSKHLCPASNTPDPNPSGRNIADHRGKPPSDIVRKQLRRHDPRPRRAFGNCDDDRLSGPWRCFAERHAAHAQADRKFLLIEGQQGQVDPQWYEPSLMALAGRSRPAICTLGLVRKAQPTKAQIPDLRRDSARRSYRSMAVSCRSERTVAMHLNVHDEAELRVDKTPVLTLR